MTEDTSNSNKVFKIISCLTVSVLGMVKYCSRGQQEELFYWEGILHDAGLHTRESDLF